MDTTELCYMSAGQLARLIGGKELSPVEVIEAHLSRIDSLEPILNSFITVVADRAMAKARQAEADIQVGRYRGPLHGVPVGLKDLYNVKGVRNTSGSRLFDDHVSEFDCTIASRFKEAGAILLGKLNLSPFAMGPTGENQDYGHMHNPWNPELIAGGSSGGSGSAAASGECTLTMGSCTGGSIRIPSSLCGIAGLKPTYGRLSRYGLTPLSWSLDHAGPMARTVEDCGLAMNAIAGYDPNDPASANVPVPDFTKALTGDIKGLKVGVPKEFFEAAIDPQIEATVRKAIQLLGELGATISEVSWPMYHHAVATTTTILTSEGTANHGKLAIAHGAQLYPPVRLRMEAGFFISAADYIQAQRARALHDRQGHELFKQVDLLVGPTEGITAYKLGTSQIKVGNSTMEPIPALTQFTRPYNLNGSPAITVPCGFSDDNLPVGLQLAGRPFDEETVLRVAYAYEQATDWHTRRPPL